MINTILGVLLSTVLIGGILFMAWCVGYLMARHDNQMSVRRAKQELKTEVS